VTTDEIKKLHAESAARVSVRCDEYHGHSARQGCLGGDERDVTICKLAEQILQDRAELVALVGDYGP
jgi:DUF971 family protein